MLIAFLTNDLVFPSRVAGVAARLGVQMEIALTAEALLEKLAAESLPEIIVLLDLNAISTDPAALVQRLKSLPVPVRAIVAFGPHVHQQKLVAAQAAGCDVVLTRGQFDAQSQTLLAELIGKGT